MSELQELVGELMPQARAASEQAYSPYSNVKVGAVVVTDDGSKYSGCNVENASYGLTQCAERNALASAVVAGAKPGTIKTVLIFGSGFKTLSPCGACRQVMSELLTSDSVVISCSAGQAPRIWSLDELFPDPFVLE
jgi:cytidine deaminase